MVALDVVGPLLAYYLLRTAGVSTVLALVLSGLLPTIGIVRDARLRGRVDAVGVLVLLGIVVGAVLGLASHSARIVLLDGTVPGFVFGIVCLGSLWSRRPLMFRFAVEMMGAETARGRDFADRWRYAGLRSAFRVVTIVWGLAFIAQAAAQIVIVETASAGVAKTSGSIMPVVVVAVVVAWNIGYAKRGQRRGQVAAEAARVRGDALPAMPR